MLGSEKDALDDDGRASRVLRRILAVDVAELDVLVASVVDLAEVEAVVANRAVTVGWRVDGIVVVRLEVEAVHRIESKLLTATSGNKLNETDVGAHVGGERKT